jgi:hypothetical protein
MGQTSLQHHRPFTYRGTQRFVFLLLSLGYSTGQARTGRFTGSGTNRRA